MLVEFNFYPELELFRVKNGKRNNVYEQYYSKDTYRMALALFPEGNNSVEISDEKYEALLEKTFANMKKIYSNVARNGSKFIFELEETYWFVIIDNTMRAFLELIQEIELKYNVRVCTFNNHIRLELLEDDRL